MRYAQLEMKLGEIDRARSLYSHGSQFSDPRVRTIFHCHCYYGNAPVAR